MRHAIALVVAGVVPIAAPSSLPAVTILVDTTVDDSFNNGNCTLREAIIAANSKGPRDLCPAGELAGNTIVLSSPGPYPFTLGQGFVSGDAPLTIRGLPGTKSTIDLGGMNRFLDVQAFTDATLENLRIRNGFDATGGGAIRAGVADLTIRSCAFESNGGRSGGAISYLGSLSSRLVLESVTFNGNSAVSANASLPAQGGAIDVTLLGLVEAYWSALLFESNFAEQSAAGGQARGGAVAITLFDEAILELSSSTFSGNSAISTGSARGGAISAQMVSTTYLRLADLDLHENVVSGPASGCAALELDTGGQSSAEALRLRLRLDDLPSAASAACALLGGTSSQLFTDTTAFLDPTPPGLALGAVSGLDVELSGASSFLAGQLTISGLTGTALSIANSGGGLARVENSILWGNGDDLATSGTVAFDPVANHNRIGELGGTDPQFVDAGNGDFRLLPTSPARDAGDSSFAAVGPFDVAHSPRIAGPATDQGAYEHGALFGWDGEEGHPHEWSAVVP